MPKIVFTADPKLPRDLKHLGYKKGDVIDLPDDQCERWIRRQVAEFAKPPEASKVNKTGAATQRATAPNPSAFDPEKATEADLREFLTKHNINPGPTVTVEKLRDAAAEIVKRS